MPYNFVRHEFLKATQYQLLVLVSKSIEKCSDTYKPREILSYVVNIVTVYAETTQKYKYTWCLHKTNIFLIINTSVMNIFLINVYNI